MDEDVKLRPLECLLYSFGVGNDFTFDEHMQDFGCEVHAFDHDNDHEIYDHRLGPIAFFHKARIGSETGFLRICEKTPHGRICEPALRYQTMADIRRNLGHEDRQLNYLKMDIEGEEWKVLHQILHNTSVLSTVSQVTLEIHLEELRSNKTVEGKRESVALYINVIQGLRNLGFQLVRHDENGLNSQYETIDGVQLSLYAELLFIRRNHAIETV
ncbi:probable methyltransferase-like protein 24 isoform X2 [Panulirus ornatus]